MAGAPLLQVEVHCPWLLLLLEIGFTYCIQYLGHPEVRLEVRVAEGQLLVHGIHPRRAPRLQSPQVENSVGLDEGEVRVARGGGSGEERERSGTFVLAVELCVGGGTLCWQWNSVVSCVCTWSHMTLVPAGPVVPGWCCSASVV
jgi:hypothetical protein